MFQMMSEVHQETFFSNAPSSLQLHLLSGFMLQNPLEFTGRNSSNSLDRPAPIRPGSRQGGFEES